VNSVAKVVGNPGSYQGMVQFAPIHETLTIQLKCHSFSPGFSRFLLQYFMAALGGGKKAYIFIQVGAILITGSK
jgi:hypothetical protein